MNNPENAKNTFNKGFNCCQAVLATYCQRYDLPVDLAMKLSGGFGGGMKQAGVCGAVTGAYMVLGLEAGNTQPDDSQAKERTTNLLSEFNTRFSNQNGSIICKDLLGCDITTDEGRAIAKEKELFQTKCPALVASSSLILDEMFT